MFNMSQTSLRSSKTFSRLFTLATVCVVSLLMSTMVASPASADASFSDSTPPTSQLPTSAQAKAQVSTGAPTTTSPTGAKPTTPSTTSPGYASSTTSSTLLPLPSSTLAPLGSLPVSPASPDQVSKELSTPDASFARLAALLPSLQPLASSSGMEDVAGRYQALSTSLVGFYAQKAGLPLDKFLNGNQATVQDSLGLAKPMQATSLSDLDSRLQALGAAADQSASQRLAAFPSMSAESLDAKVQLAAADYAQQAASLRVPELTMPGAPAPSAPQEAFGSLYASSLSSMANNHPDVLAQVQAAGFSPESSAAWQDSMARAYAAASKDVGSTLNPCYSDLMTSMATGVSSSSPGCGSCATAGLYLHSQLDRLFDPSLSSTNPSPTDSLIPPAEFNALPDWQRQLYVDQNPQLNSSLSDSLGQGDLSCRSSGSAQTLNQTLPGAFASLGQ